MIGAIYDFITLPAQVMEANMRRSFYDNANVNNNNYTQPKWRNVDDGEAHIIHEKDEN